MLATCAPGHTRKERDHHWVVMFNGRTFPSLPKGPHGKRTNPGIQIGHVRQMVRLLEVEACAKQQIETLSNC